MKNRTPSLKTLLREIGPLLGLSEDQAYERQRELVRCGLLKVREGMGPGSGVPANHHTTSVLIASILTTDLLRDLRLLISSAEFAMLVEAVECAIRSGSELAHIRSDAMRTTTVEISASVSEAIHKLLQRNDVKQAKEKSAKKSIGRPRKYPDSRMSLSVRVTEKVYAVLNERAAESGRSLSEEMEMVFEKAFFPMDEATAERIRGPNHATQQERIHQA
jgi:hypothetical protein